MATHYWLLKTEPDTYSWQDLLREGRSCWDGVRNFEARKHLRAMRAGDIALFYHTGNERQVVGLVRVVREAYPDPTADDGDWSAVDVEPVKAFLEPVALRTLKQEPAFEDLLLVRRGRLSVGPVSAKHFRQILKLGKTQL